MARVLVFEVGDAFDNNFLTYLDEEAAKDLLALRPKNENAPGQAQFIRLYLLEYEGDPHHLVQDPTPFIKAAEEDPDTTVILASRLQDGSPPRPCTLSYLGKKDLIAVAWPRWGVSFAGAGLQGWLDWEDLESFVKEVPATPVT